METMEQASASIVAFAAGILATIFLPALPDSGSVIVLSLLALMALRNRRIALVGYFVLGLCWHSHTGRQLLATEIPESWQQGSFQLQGVVRSLPRSTIDVDGSVRSSFEFDVERVFSEGRPLQFTGPLVVRLSWRDAGAIAANQRWRLSTVLQRPRGLANPGTFDYRAWLLSRGVGATGRVLADDGNVLLGSGNSYLVALRQWYRVQFEHRFSGEPGLPLLAALGIGDKQQMTPAQRQVLEEDHRDKVRRLGERIGEQGGQLTILQEQLKQAGSERGKLQVERLAYEETLQRLQRETSQRDAALNADLHDLGQRHD